jgi:hypothetical protein
VKAFLTAFGRFLDASLSRQEDASALGLARAVYGAVLTVVLLGHVGHVGEFFSDESVINGRFARLAFSDHWSLFLPAQKGQEEAWHAGFYVADPFWVRAVFAGGVVAHLMWTVGLFTRLAGVACLALWVSMIGRNPMLYAYPDHFLMAILVLMVLMPCGRGFSLDASWRGKGGTVPVWCRRLLHFQIAIMYLVTGLAKHGKTWHEDGTALYYSLMNPYNRHFALSSLWAHLQPWVLRPSTYLTLYWEICFPLFVVANWLREARSEARWPRDWRWLFLGLGVMVHGGVWPLLYTVAFSPLVLASYFAFLQPSEARKLIQRVFPARASKA